MAPHAAAQFVAEHGRHRVSDAAKALPGRRLSSIPGDGAAGVNVGTRTRRPVGGSPAAIHHGVLASNYIDQTRLINKAAD